MNKKRLRLLIVICVTVLYTFFSSSCFINDDGKGSYSNDLVINEVMINNVSTLKDNDSEYSDWIELYNGSNKTINLKGFTLTDDYSKLDKWAFPEITIEPDKYLLVFASGKDKVDLDAGVFHTNFSLKIDESLVLCDSNKKILNKVTFIGAPEDVSYGILGDKNEKEYVYLKVPTPGKKNSSDEYIFENESTNDNGQSIPTTDLFINEYMSNNSYTIFDSEGDTPSWIEIYNSGDKDISLKGFTLTDNIDNVEKWKFPDITIKADEYVVLLLSGKDIEYKKDKEIHVDFKIGKSDEIIMLSDPQGRLVHSVDVQDLPENISQGRNAEGNVVFFPRATPGKINSTEGFVDLIEAKSLDNRKVWINEVMAVSYSEELDGVGATEWIELYNGSDSDINLAGYGLSDSTDDLYKLKFPAVTLKPDSYYLINATGSYSFNEKNNKLTSPFKVSADGETIYLSDANGVTIDGFNTGRLKKDYSSGRIGTSSDERYFFAAPTPGGKNTSMGFKSYAQPCVISPDGGFIKSGDYVTITTAQNGATIRFTQDGSMPTEKSPVYETPIKVMKNTTIKAIAFHDNFLPSIVSCRTFIVDAPHDLPVVCLSTNPDNLFGHSNGIFANGPGWTSKFPHVGANFWKEWEREAHIEYYTEKGDLGIDFDAGIKLFGQYSRAEEQKSISINLGEEYGTTEVCYPFFLGNKVTVFKNLLLRTSGQDWGITKLKDAFCAEVIKGQIDLEFMDSRPVAVYINGEYWGLYNLREKVNESYLSSHRGLNPDNVDIIKANKNVRAGTFDAYSNMLNYVKTHDLRVKENYDYVASIVDIDNFIDYWIVETFFNNTDTGNIKFYRERKDGAKWRWILFDMDWAMFKSTYEWNMIEEFINPDGHGVGNNFDTTLAFNLMKNNDFRDRFISRYAQFLNTTFKAERTVEILDDMASEISSEIPRHIDRWGKPSSVDRWESNIDSLKEMLREKPNITIDDIKETFDLNAEQMKRYFGR